MIRINDLKVNYILVDGVSKCMRLSCPGVSTLYVIAATVHRYLYSGNKLVKLYSNSVSFS